MSDIVLDGDSTVVIKQNHKGWVVSVNGYGIFSATHPTEHLSEYARFKSLESILQAIDKKQQAMDTAAKLQVNIPALVVLAYADPQRKAEVVKATWRGVNRRNGEGMWKGVSEYRKIAYVLPTHEMERAENLAALLNQKAECFRREQVLVGSRYGRDKTVHAFQPTEFGCHTSFRSKTVRVEDANDTIRRGAALLGKPIPEDA